MSDEAGQMAGRVLGGRYRLARLLGEGGMGAVYEGRQLDLDRRVAIKVLRATDPAGLERFRREAVAAGGLASPHVVAVLDFQAPPGEVPFLVMERLEGQTLSALLAAEHRLEPARAVRIAIQMLLGLEAAHRASIVHRDVKPSNVWLLGGQGLTDHVKLLDFGIAKLLGPDVTPLTTSQELVGTPAYLAPEQIRGTDLDPRTDLHAVGVVLYEAISGSLPFTKPKDGGALLVEILREVPPPLHEILPSVPIGLSLVVARAMAKDPEARFARAEEMRQALAPFAGSSEVTPPAIRDGGAPAPAARTRSGAVFAAGIAGALVVGLGGLAIGLALSHPEPPAKAAPEAGAPTVANSASSAVRDAVGAAPAPALAEAGAPPATATRPSPVPPPAGQRPRCTCVTRRGSATVMVCTTPKTPSCACNLASGYPACPVKFVDGKCDYRAGPQLDAYGGPGRVSAAPCRGYDIGGVEATGTLYCTTCYGEAIVPGVPGAPCTGVLRGTETTVTGTFACD